MSRGPYIGGCQRALSLAQDASTFGWRALVPDLVPARTLRSPTASIGTELLAHRDFWHWGGNLYFESYLLGCPRERIAVVVMSNRSRGRLITCEVAKKVLGEWLKSWSRCRWTV